MKRLILALALFFSLSAYAGVPTPEQARSVWVLAWGETHSLHNGDRTILDNPPNLNIMRQPPLCALWGLQPNCGLLGLTISENEILLSELIDFRTPFGGSIIFHEFVHIIQYRTRGKPQTCEQRNEYEKQAHEMQAAVLIKVGDHDGAELVLSAFSPRICVEHIL